MSLTPTTDIPDTPYIPTTETGNIKKRCLEADVDSTFPLDDSQVPQKRARTEISTGCGTTLLTKV